MDDLALTPGCYLNIDGTGLATLTFDLPGKVNVMNEQFMAAIEAALTMLEDPAEALRGLIITSAKSTFIAGGDLAYMRTAEPSQKAVITAYFERLKGALRRLEKLDFPVVAVINGTALGGGYELCLACHYRIAVQSEKSHIGLPEVHFAILPGAGGVVRLTRLLGIDAALPILLSGQRLNIETAYQAGLVDKVAGSIDDALIAARVWIAENPHPRQIWDMAPLMKVEDVRPVPTIIDKDAEPGAAAEISALANYTQISDFDSALFAETRGFVRLLLAPAAKTRIEEFFNAQSKK